MLQRLLCHTALRTRAHLAHVGPVCVLVFLVGLAAPASITAAITRPARAVELARSGQIAEALAILASEYANNPQDQTVYYDYLTVLSWAGEDDRVAELASRFSPRKGPGYALESVAKSARRRGDFVLAEMLYRIGLERFPADLDFPVGLILTLSDAGSGQNAIEVARLLEKQYPDHPELLLAKGYAEESQGDYFAALRTHQRILEHDPDDRPARARQIMLLDRLGASHRAVELADKDPSLLTEAEWQRIRDDQAAHAVRWGNLDTSNTVGRFAQTDRALALLDRNLLEAQPARSDDPNTTLRTRFDRMVALRNRFRMDLVVEEYQRLAQQGLEIPAYALSAAADAYLYRKQPEQAESLYQQVLVRQPDDFAAQLGRFYCLIELEELDAARNLIDRLDQGQPSWFEHTDENGQRQRLPNPRKIATASAAAMARAYGDQLDEAEQRLTALHNLAPANLDLTSALGDIYAARGWPRLALQTFRLGLSLDPQYKALQLGLAQSYLTRREYRLAEASIERLIALYPEDQHIRLLHRQWQIHNLRELRLSAGYSENSGTTLGSRELLLEGMLFSRPLAYQYRMFLSSRYAFAALPEGDESYRRQGVGVEYRGPDLEAVAELTYNADGGDELGGRLSLNWEFDDHWSLPATLELFSRDTPLRALKQGITADSADLGIVYRASESRRASLRTRVMNFSDGNFRRSLTGGLEQLLVTRPGYQLNGTIDLSASANSRNGTVYFNPERDFTATLTLGNLQRLYRRYDRVFSHRLDLTLGSYWQKNFASDYLAGFAYEHIWEFAYRFELVYGFSRFRRVYDGLPEFQNYTYGRLNWRF
jgi:biofilm PGA synthesis protein PgaA